MLKALKFSSIIIANTPNKQKFIFETFPFSVSSCRSLPKVWILYMINISKLRRILCLQQPVTGLHGSVL